MIRACITEEELRKALEAVERAKARGFDKTLAILELKTVGETISDHLMEQDGLILKNERTDWGYISNDMIDWYKCENNECVDV
jgi:hypothetical protein